MEPAFGSGVFASSGNKWKVTRDMIRPFFDNQHIADLRLLERHVQNLLSTMPLDDSPVDLQPLFFRFTLDLTIEFLFGENMNTLTVRSAADSDFEWAFDHVQRYVDYRMRLGPFMNWRKQTREDKRAIYIVRQFARNLIDTAKTKLQAESTDDKRHHVFLYHLMQQETDTQRLMDEVLNMLLAGRDTTASLLANMFFFITKDPRIWQNLKHEVQETLCGKLPSLKELEGMKHLRWCVTEGKHLKSATKPT